MKILDSIPHNKEYEDDKSKGVVIIEMATYNALSEKQIGDLYDDINELCLGVDYLADVSSIHDTISFYWG